jgi:hypothetical protein
MQLVLEEMPKAPESAMLLQQEETHKVLALVMLKLKAEMQLELV